MFKNYRLKKQLAKCREDLKTITDEAYRRKAAAGHDQYRWYKDYLKRTERSVLDGLLLEEWALCDQLGEKPEYASVRDGGGGADDDSPVGFVTVKENRSSKVTMEYDEEEGKYIFLRDGQPEILRRWKMENGEPVLDEDGKNVWEDYKRGFSRESFEREWRYDEELHEATDAWHHADTEAEKAEIVRLFKAKRGIE